MPISSSIRNPDDPADATLVLFVADKPIVYLEEHRTALARTDR